MNLLPLPGMPEPIEGDILGRCDQCDSPNGQLIEDPYAIEALGLNELLILCDPCAQLRADDA